MEAPTRSSGPQPTGIPRPHRRGRGRRPIDTGVSIDLAHIAGLSALAVAQPTLTLIAGNTEFLATHDGRGWRLAVLVASLVLGPASLAVVLELVAGSLGSRARAVVHSMLVAILVAVLARQALDRMWPGADTWVVLGLALGAGVAFTVAYRRLEPMRTLVTFLAVSTIVVPAAFFLDVRVRGFLADIGAVKLYPVEITRPVPLVFVIFDELPLATLLDREGEAIDADVFPSFARLAATSNWYPRATTTGAFTVLAVPSLHNGRYSPTDRPLSADLVGHPENLFTLFGSTYDVHALETTVHLLPDELAHVVNRVGDTSAGRLPLLLADTAAIALQVTTPRPWSARLPRIGDAWTEFWAPSVGDRRVGAPPSQFRKLRDFIDALAPSSRPPLVYMHPFFPHSPWNTLPSGRSYFDWDPTLPRFFEAWPHDQWLLRQAYQRHRVQVAAADTVLGNLLDRLEALGWFDDAVVVVTSDHGVAFTPGVAPRDVQPEHEEVLRGELMPVPLLIKFPGQRTPVVDERVAEFVDVLPTIADALDIALPWQVDGRSLLEPASATAHRRRLQLTEPYTALDFDDRESSPATAVARRYNAAFGRTPDGRTDLFKIGPEQELLGRRVDSAESLPHRAVLKDENLYQGISSDDPRLPALVRGTIEPAAGSRVPAGAAIAVAINGVLRATTQATETGDGEISFSALVPEEAFAAGDNHVEVFLIGDQASLARLEATGSQEVLREVAKTSPALFAADTRTGWAGFEAVLDTRLEPGPAGDLVVDSPGGPLRANLPLFDARGADSIVVAIDVEAEVALTLTLYYQVEHEPAFNIRRFVRGSTSRGRSITYIVVENPDLVGALSIDFGRGEPVRVHSIEVRAAR